MKSKQNSPLTFDEWNELNTDKINLMLAETGADRELDFDSELEFSKRYQSYLDQDHSQTPKINSFNVYYRLAKQTGNALVWAIKEQMYVLASEELLASLQTGAFHHTFEVI